jgi:hypothetical protein
MSISPHRVRWFRTLDVCVSAALLSSLGCHHAPPPEPQPTVAEPSAAQRLPMTDEGRAPRFAGVDVVPASRLGFLIRIHSASVGDGEPLYVIDGVRMNIPPNRGIDWFKPEDIVDIKVLKQPHELAEYGPAGVNGVIVITTKLALRRSQRP